MLLTSVKLDNHVTNLCKTSILITTNLDVTNLCKT